MKTTQYSLRHKIIAWMLTLALVITLIPELGYAAQNPQDKKSADQNKQITEEDVSESDVIDKDEASTTYDLGGGKKMTVFHGGQVRYENEDGEWEDYDPSLLKVKSGEKTLQNKSLKGYSYTNKVGDKKHYIPERISEETPIRMEYNDYAVEFAPTNKSLGKIDVLNDAITVEDDRIQTAYDDNEILPVNAVYGGEKDKASLTYTSTGEGVKETLLFEEKPESNVFTYTLKLTGMVPRKNVLDEGITFFDKETQDITGYITAPWMNDATGEAYSESITYDIEQVEGTDDEYVLTMTIDEDYLADEKRQYPVTVDPSLTWQGTTYIKDTYVISGTKYGNTNFYSSETKILPVGKSSNGSNLSYMHFVNLQDTITGNDIESAIFTAYETGSSTSGQTVGIYRVMANWSAATITYNNRPGTSTLYATSTTKGTTYAVNTFDVTKFAKDLEAHAHANYGLQLHNYKTNPGFACFFGTRAASYKPKLVVTYSTTPAAPTGVSLSSPYVNDSTAAKLNFTKPSNAARVEYKITKYDEATQTEGAVVTDFSASTAITTGSSLPTLKEGCYKVYVRGVNSAGTAGTAASAGILHVDSTLPVFESMALKNAAGESIAGKATGESNPLIEFSGVTDTHINSSCITYAINYAGIEPDASEYKTPNSLNISAAKPYSGTFRLTADDQTLPTGNYTISVKVKDLAGNERIKKFNYNKDNDDPTGSIIITNMTTGNEVSTFNEPVNVEVTVDGTGSKLKESTLKLYKATTDSSGKVTGVDTATEVLIDKNFTMSENIVFDTLDLCDSYGKYRLVLNIKDGVGRTKEITKDFTVSYVLAAPDKAEIAYSTGGTADFTWSFPYNAQQKIKLNSIWAKFGEDGQWQQIVAPGEDGTLPFEGTAHIAVPTVEGAYDVQVYGKSNDGSIGAIKSVQCVVDKTNPVVEISGLNQNYLTGIIYDDNIADWRIYIKDKEAAEFPEEPIEKGIYAMGFIYEEYKNESPLCYIDFSSDEYEPGHEYTVKIVANDKSGHITEKTLDIVSPSTEFMPSYIPAELEVEDAHPLWSTGHFILGPENGTLRLKGNVENATWYINNRKASPEIVDPNGNLTQDEGWWHDFLALTKDEKGNRKYTVDRIKNGLCETVSFTADEITGNVGEKYLYFYSSGIAFQIAGAPEGATYEISPDAMDEEPRYFTVEPNKIYYVDELYDNSVFSNSLNVRVTAAEGQNIQDIQFKIYADNIVNQHFMYSEADYYTPQNLRIESKINHRTYLKWDIEGTLPEDISYNVHRSTEPDFLPSNENLVAEGLKTGYYTEMNVSQSEKFYYQVCAVKKELVDVYEDEMIYNEYYSPYIEVEGARAVDQNEFLKRLGMKDFWQFTEFKTTNGNGYVEKSKGNFIYQQKDAEIPNEGFEVSLNRTYNSQSSTSGAFGFGWTHDYDIELLNICENNSTEFTHVVLKDGNGTLYHFTRNPGEEHFVSSFGSYANLTAETAEQTKEVIVSGLDTNNTVSLKYQFVLSTSDGVKYYFNSGGQLILMEDGNEKFVIFEYDAKLGVLSKMVTNNNSNIQFVYNDLSVDSTMLTVKEIRLPDGSKVQYEYTKPALSAEQLLTKVTKVASDGSTVSYEYKYDKGILSLQPHNLSVIKDATGQREYKINYNYGEDQVSDLVYPNNEKLTFDYSKDNTSTVVKKIAAGQVVMGEKDYFDRVFGKCEKSIRGVDDVSKLSGTDETGLDVTTYEYRDRLLTSTTTTAEYRRVDADGYVVERIGTKTGKAEYSGDQPSKEIEEDGTVSEYTYYDSEAGENLGGQIKTVRETNAEGKTVGYKEYAYDDALNTTQVIDYVAGTKIVNTYYTEGAFKGEIHTMQEYLLNVSSTFAITGETLQSTSTYTYENVTTDGVTTKVESCTQVLPKPDGTNETITISSTYDAMGRKLNEVDSRGYRTVNTYDGFGRLTATTYKYSDSNALKQSTAFTYDANNMITYEKLADGTEKWYTYDNMYRVTSTKVKKGNTEETINTTYSYQDVDIYQGKGNDTVSVNKAYVTTQSYSDGTVISKTYEDHQGNLVRQYSGGLYTDMTYNSQGDIITKWVMGKNLSATEGVLQLYIHDDKGNLIQTITDPDYKTGTETTGYYVREDSTEEDATYVQGSIVTKSSYNSDGNVIDTTDAEGNKTAYTYDKQGNLTSVLQPDNAKYEYQYDVNGAGATTMDIVLEPRVTGTDAGRAMSKSVVTKDATDKVIKVEDFGVSDTDDTSISTSYEYDVRDNLIKATEKNGNYKLYTYDARDRVISFDYYEMSGDTAVKTLRTEFTYDDSDNITSMTDKEVASDGTETIYRYTAYGYDDFNRLAYVSECDTDAVPTENEINANKVSYSYDIKDRLISIDYPDSHKGITGLRFNYDANNWLQNVTAVKEDGNTSLLRTYTYDNYGRTSEITDYPDTVNSTSKWIKRVFTYDKLDRVTGIEYYDNMSGSSTDVKESHIYTYDKNSNISSEEYRNHYGKTNGTYYGETIYYQYDVNGRLLSEDRMEVVSETAYNTIGETYYTYDAAGNMTYEEFFVWNSNEGTQKTTSYTYNEFNQLTASTLTDYVESTTLDKTYTYDANGNRVSETDSAGKQTNYTYDAAGCLKTVTGKTGETVDFVQTNKYNGYGQRVQKSETVGATTDTANYFYDGSQILYTTDGNDKVTSFNMMGAENNIILTGRPGDTAESDPKFYVYTKDIRKSTTNVVGTDGKAAVSYSYDTFGETTEYQQNENDPFYNEICYTAGVYDKTTGLYNLSARYYDPADGTFLSQDTYRGSKSRTATLNYYAYCAGNPVSYTDPSGHAFWAVAGAAMGAYDGYQYAKKKGLTGWKKGAAIVGGALLGAVNPFKIVGKVGKAVKVVKAVKTAKKAKKATKALKSTKIKPKPTLHDKKTAKGATVGNKTYKSTGVAKVQRKTITGECFVAGTKISTDKGFMPIEKIKPGDHVWSENPETNEKALKKVNKIFVREKDSIIRLSINGEVIETTDTHPFYVEGKGFVVAGSLNYGDEVRLQSGDTATVESVEEIQLDEPIKVYNFEVEDFHTYYVSEHEVLVHNMCAQAVDEATKPKYWSEAKQVNGKKVYQRNDLFDPNAVDWRGRTNLDRMKKGIAPIGEDGKSINLHHMIQTENSAIAEVTATFHRKNSRIIHINPRTVRSGINRRDFAKWRREYWKQRVKDFE